ncbi:MAG: response regulator transcription factor [Chloroflexi bacterium]|nr:response regulator transcription factor [Chloroflexota bacterium]
MTIKIVVADDHKLFRQGLIGLMRAHDDMVEVIGEAASGQEAVQLAQQLRPDVILMDIQMPNGDGLQATRQIRETLPDVAVVILTASESDEHLYEAIRLGAAGYLLKDLDAAELFELLAGVADNEVVMTRAMASRFLKIMADNNGRAPSVSSDLTERGSRCCIYWLKAPAIPKSPKNYSLPSTPSRAISAISSPNYS